MFARKRDPASPTDLRRFCGSEFIREGAGTSCSYVSPETLPSRMNSVPQGGREAYLVSRDVGGYRYIHRPQKTDFVSAFSFGSGLAIPVGANSFAKTSVHPLHVHRQKHSLPE